MSLLFNNGLPSQYDIRVRNLTIDSTLTIPTGAVADEVLTSDANGNATWQPSSGGSGRVLRLVGTQGAVNVVGVSVIIGQNALQPLTLQSLAGGVDGQQIQIIADNIGRVTIKNNTSIGSDQSFWTYTNVDLVLPLGGNTVGYASVVYDAVFGRWVAVQIA
jgi:hypothetical protein